MNWRAPMGALGGKLIGAGGGGFLHALHREQNSTSLCDEKCGLREVRLQFDFSGTSVLAHS